MLKVFAVPLTVMSVTPSMSNVAQELPTVKLVGFGLVLL
jgi:hypothetical protein